MEDKESENESKRSSDRSPSPAVKSTAVVKYTAFQTPVSYSRLQCNTDLNLPPSNWGAEIDAYGLKQILTRGGGFSSFRMAHMFPDCVGDVDVISGAECIKKLLKLPYQPNGTVSMMVHRVENTLLLDDFDLYDYLMKSEWAWLKDFFYENVVKTMSEQERMALTLAPAPSSALQLTHKFLSHSISESPEINPILPASPTGFPGPFLPEPESRTEEPPNEHLYNQNVLWTFEDIHMLIGSDLPVFGDKDRPCVSLRLRDAKEPINVLTGIDYWLDNLMCNVPEVLMCYHLDGIVQKYEPMKTEDLPNLENSKFSPKVIRNVAQNILSFLKSNATKAGHTYWLFKGPGDEVVKLYDLTSLCPDGVDCPFRTPVGMLVYRVARNRRAAGRKLHVRRLLTYAVRLLSEESHPHIVASAHYMLSDLYVPASTDPACPDFADESSESESEETEECSEERSDLAVATCNLALRDIGHRADKTKSVPRTRLAGAAGGAAARCGRALAHALSGLRALTRTHQQEDERDKLKQKIISEEQNPKMANPYESIKMDYSPIKNKKENAKEHVSRSRRRKRDKKAEKKDKTIVETNPNVDKNAISIRKNKNVFRTLNEPSRDDNFAWKLHLKTLLYEKLCLAYATLAEYSYAKEHYGFSLKYIDMASKCQKLLSNMIIKSRVIDASCLIGRVGDNYFQLGKHWTKFDQFKKQFETDHDIDKRLRVEIENDMLEEVGGDVASPEFDLDISLPETDLSSMELSRTYYRRAMRATDRREELLRRLASVENELAVRYMNDAQQIYLNYTDEEDLNSEHAKKLLEQFNSLSEKSWESLNQSCEIFSKVNDVTNLALLYCNKGRYMRFKAHCDQGKFTSEKRSLYKQAEELYGSALRVCGSGSASGPVRDLVAWELSGHLYTKAALLQDRPDNTQQDVGEVAEALKYALKHCQLSPGPRQYLYQFRAAMIYHRLGSLYHSQYRLTTEDGPKRRSLLSSTQCNYTLAANMFAHIEDAAMSLTVHLEHVALHETHAHVSPNLKLKSMRTAIQLLRQCHSVIKLIKEKDPEDNKETPKLDDHDEGAIKNEYTLLSLYENRLHHILKSIIQYFRSKSNKDYEKISEMYKKLYCVSLKIKKDDDVRLYAASICDVLDAMDKISNDYE